jgi:hypothetical protein
MRVLFVALVLTLTSAERDQNPPATHRIVTKSRKNYPIVKTGDLTDCDYLNEPCKNLNDVWGYEYMEDGVEKSVAIVGMSNGLDVLDVTDMTKPIDIAYFHGCENVWRDIKRYNSTLYGISEYTATCACESGACQEHISVLAPASIAKWYPATEGRLSPSLEDIGNVTGNVWPVPEYNADGCLSYLETIPTERNPGTIYLMPLGGCEISQKILNAQDAGAIGVLMINPVDNIIYPGMEGNPENLTIPTMLLGFSDGNLLASTVNNGENVTVLMTADNKQASDFFEPSEGLWVIDMKEPNSPRQWFRRDWFRFAHNVAMDEERGLMYTVGMSGIPNTTDRTRQDVANGGFLVFDVTANQTDPQLIGEWNVTYVHDMISRECEGQWLAFTADIYNDDCYVVNVSDPRNPTTIMSWPARMGAAHNIWLDRTCEVAYVTHEKGREPISVWRFRRDADTNLLRFDLPPRYQGILAINQFGGSLPHNAHVEEDILWASYYEEGVVAWNISVPWEPVFMAQTLLEEDGSCSTWGVYPHHPSKGGDVAYASDINCGFYVLELEALKTSASASNQEGTIVALSICLALSLGGVMFLCYQRNRNTSYQNFKSEPAAVGLGGDNKNYDTVGTGDNV